MGIGDSPRVVISTPGVGTVPEWAISTPGSGDSPRVVQSRTLLDKPYRLAKFDTNAAILI